MTDVALLWDAEQAQADIAVFAADLLLTESLDSAVIISLFTDRRAPADIQLPPGDHRRGWWGDSYPDIEGDELGSLLWLLAREKQTPEVLARARRYAREALAWMVADGIARSIEVVASFADRGLLQLSIEILRSSGERERFSYRLDPTGAVDPFLPPPGLPGEIQGASGVPAIAAESWAAGESGSTAEVQGASGVPAIAAAPWSAGDAPVPGERRGSGGPAAMVADTWHAEVVGLSGEVGCGGTLAPIYPTADSTLGTADTTAYTADEAPL